MTLVRGGGGGGEPSNSHSIVQAMVLKSNAHDDTNIQSNDTNVSVTEVLAVLIMAGCGRAKGQWACYIMVSSVLMQAGEFNVLRPF